MSRLMFPICFIQLNLLTIHRPNSYLILTCLQSHCPQPLGVLEALARPQTPLGCLVLLTFQCWKCSMHSFIPPGSLMSQPHTHSPLGSSKENSPRIPWNRKKFQVEVIYSSEYFTEKWLHLLVMPLHLITFQN